jgi:hypothetical protein
MQLLLELVADSVLKRMGGTQAGKTTIDEFRETKAQTANNAGTV